MTVSFPLDFPTHTGLIRLVLRERNVVGVSTSPFSGIQQVQEFSGGWWEGEFSIRPMYREHAEPWLAFLSSLRGQTGTFLMGDPLATAPRGSAAQTPGTPQVDGASQSGLTLAIKTGLTGPVTDYLKAGDKFSLSTGATRQLYKVVKDVDLDAAGKATMDIWPRLR